MRSEETTTSLGGRLKRLAGDTPDSSAPCDEMEMSTADVTADDVIILARPDPNLAPQDEPPLIEERAAELDDPPTDTAVPTAGPSPWPARVRRGAVYATLLVMGAFLGRTLVPPANDVTPAFHTASISSESSDSGVNTQDAIAGLRSSLDEARRALSAAEQRNGRLAEKLAEAVAAREAAERHSTEVEANRAALHQVQTAAVPVLHDAAPAQPQQSLEHAVVGEAQPPPRVAPSPEMRPEPVIADQKPQDGATGELAPKTAASDTPPPSEPGARALSAGQQHFKNGKLDAARREFERAVEQGLPEGALALGTTFDPVSLARAGIDAAGDPKRARYWYRKAHEAAQYSLQRQ